jgi:hypothetical protein
MTDAPDVISSGSPEAMHTRGGDNAHMQITRIELGERAKATLFALSIAVNIICIWIIFYSLQETKLKEYDLASFKSDNWAPLIARMDSLAGQQQALENRIQVREECRR